MKIQFIYIAWHTSNMYLPLANKYLLGELIYQLLQTV